jgi:Zn-dependent protease with chaperone function
MLTSDFADECERIAVKLRRELHLWGYDPLPARMLAEHMGIGLLAPRDLGMSPDEVEQAVRSTAWWAITVLTKPRIVIYHPRATRTEFEANLMHELAHILCEHEPEQLGLISDFRVARKYSKRQEFEADTLGLCLQVPRIAWQYARQRNWTVEQIAGRFYVSLEIVRSRL